MEGRLMEKGASSSLDEELDDLNYLGSAPERRGSSKPIRPRTNTGGSEGGVIQNVAEAIHTRMIQAFKGKNDRTRLVIKATSHDSEQPKSKYVRKIIMDSWENRHDEVGGGAARWYFHELENRPVGSTALVALKGLIVTLKLVQLGPPEALQDSIKFINMIEKIGRIWKDLDEGANNHTHSLALLISSLSQVIIQKLHFHKNQNEYDVFFKLKDKHVSDDEDMLSAVSRMLTLQSTVDACQRLAFSVMTFENSAIGVIIPLIDESHALYAGTTQIIAKLMSGGKMKRIAEQLTEQYDLALECLRLFYAIANGNELVKSFGRIPTLPDESPLHDAKNAVTISLGSFASIRKLATDRIEEGEEEEEDMNVIGGIYVQTENGLYPVDASPPNNKPLEVSLDSALSSQLKINANKVCADCNDKGPKWLSVNLGVVVCIKCSGAHRKLGVHVSQIKSLTLDTLQPAYIRALRAVGNEKANMYWEGTLSVRGAVKPNSSSSLTEIETFVRDKYEKKKYILRLSSPKIKISEKEKAKFNPFGISSEPKKSNDVYDPFSLIPVKESPRDPPSPMSPKHGDGKQWSCGTCTFLNHALLKACEMCGHPCPDIDSTASGSWNNPSPPPAITTSSSIDNKVFDPFSLLNESVAVSSPSTKKTTKGEKIMSLDFDPFSPSETTPIKISNKHSSLPATSVLFDPFAKMDSSTLLPKSFGPTDMNVSPFKDKEMSTPLFDKNMLQSLYSNNSSYPQYNYVPPPPPVIPPVIKNPINNPFVSLLSPSPISKNSPVNKNTVAFSDPFTSTVVVPLKAPPPPPNKPSDLIRNGHGMSVESALAAALSDLELTGVNITWDELVVKETIGVGGFAEVFLGLYKGGDVAVKRLRVSNMTARAIQDFKSEVSFMKTLRHPNILLFLGVCVKPVCLITEYCKNGNLFDVLHATEPTDEKTNTYCIELSWNLKIKMAMDAARGINFLHTSVPPIIHRDLKSLNLLVDDKWCVKVADFGLSRFRASTDSVLMTGQCGTFQWMAPEVISSQIYSEKADVYSFGINLWEIYTRQTPFEGLQPLQVAVAVSTQNKRPVVPIDCPAWYSSLITSCWHQDPDNRPSFNEIIKTLKKGGPLPPPSRK